MVDQDLSTITNRDDPKKLEPVFTAYCAALEQGYNALPVEYKYRARLAVGDYMENPTDSQLLDLRPQHLHKATRHRGHGYSNLQPSPLCSHMCGRFRTYQPQHVATSLT